MTIWLVTIGEPLPLGQNDRVWRTGYIGRLLAEQGHDVVWWTSAFDHFKKRHLFPASTTVTVADRFHIRALKGRGYRRNISLSRFVDHRQLGRAFAREIAAAAPPAVILASLPTVELALASVEYGRAHRVPVVVDLRDMWPDIFVDHAPSLIRPVMRALTAPLFRDARAACAGATALVGITDDFLAWGLNRAGRTASPLDRVFPLGYVTEEPAAAELVTANAYWDGLGVGRPNRMTACFIGTMNAQYDLDAVIRAARSLAASGSPIQFVLAGLGDRLDHYKQQASDLSNVMFPGWLDYPKIFSLLRRAQVGLDPIPGRYDYLATINNKAIEYCSAGVPVISSPDQGMLAKFLVEHGCGMSYPQGDGDALAALLAALAGQPDRLAEMGRMGRRVFDESFRADRVYGACAEYLVQLAKGKA